MTGDLVIIEEIAKRPAEGTAAACEDKPDPEQRPSHRDDAQMGEHVGVAMRLDRFPVRRSPVDHRGLFPVLMPAQAGDPRASRDRRAILDLRHRDHAARPGIEPEGTRFSRGK